MAVNVLGGPLEFDAVINNSQFKRQIDEMENRLRSLTTTAEKEAEAMDRLVRNAANAIAGYVSFTAASSFIQQIVQVRGEFQQLEIAFRTMLKNKAQADLLMQQVVQLAAVTPFNLQDVGSGAKQLLAYGFAAGEVTKNLEMLGNIASGVGAPLNDIVYLYGTLKTQGQVFNRDILQFTARGIPIVQELAAQFGVTESEIKKMVEAGKVGFKDVEKAFQNLTSESGKFYNLMREQSKSLTGQVSNLQDAWSRMLNEIGRSNEGILSGALSAATRLIDNYQDVLDIIKVLVITYGAYRAAVIVTTAVQITAAEAQAGVTIATKLYYGALIIAEKAQALLNATMLANPYVLTATAIGALIAALLVFKRETTNVQSSATLLSEALKKSGAAFKEQEDKIKATTVALRDAKVSREELVSVYDKLKAINPDIVKGLDREKLQYQALKGAVDGYLESLRRQIQLEASKDAAIESIKAEEAIKKQIKAAKEFQQFQQENRFSGTNANIFAPGLQGVAEDASARNVAKLEEDLKRQEKVTKEIVEGQKKIEDDLSVKTTETITRTVSYYDEEIKKLNELRNTKATNHEEYKRISKEIEELEKKKLAITGKSQQQTKTEETAAQRAAKRLQDLLSDISQAEQDSNNAGLTQLETELEKIDKRFDSLTKRAQDLKAGDGVFQRIENARATAKTSERDVQEFNSYRDMIQNKAQVFQNYEDLKLQYGSDAAAKLLQDQSLSAGSYINYLKAELAKVEGDLSTKGKLKKQALATALTEAEKQQIERDTQFRIDQYAKVVEMTTTINAQRLRLEKDYQDDVKTLEANFSGEELQQRLEARKALYNQELTDLQGVANRSTDIYKKLNEDILFYTRQQLIARKKELEKYLSSTANIPPGLRNQIKQQVDQIDDLIKEGGKGFSDWEDDLRDISDVLQTASRGFAELSGAVEGINEGLADTLSVLSQITSVATNVTLALANFASGNILGGVAASIGAIVGVFKLASAARQSEKKAREEMDGFIQKVIAGELEINRIYRQRQQEQVKLNALKLEGLAAEKILLDEQRDANLQDYNRILQELQKQTFIVGQTTEKYGGFLGIGRKTRVVNITETLAGKSYQDLEKLFAEGRLEGKALELFKLLQTIKEEGADIDSILAQNALEAQQVFTATTADSIVDSLAEGFKNGLRTASDFAGNFEDLMRNAIINALKYQALEAPLNQFYKEFADAAQSGGILTEEEIKRLRENYNTIIEDAGTKFDELQKITAIDFQNQNATGNQTGLSGAIKGITAEQADLLAGQFGGLRLTAVDHLNVARSGLVSLQNIEIYTSNLVVVRRVLESIELNGLKVK